MKIPLEDLIISEPDPASTFLGILDEHALVVEPKVFQEIKVGKIESAVEGRGIIVKDLALAMELVLCPVALVGEFTTFIEEPAPAVHLVVLPVALIEASILVEELALSIPESIPLVALVPGTSLVLLNHVFVIG